MNKKTLTIIIVIILLLFIMAINGIADKETYYVWCTPNGTYYHVNANCSGMKNASLCSLETAIIEGKKACPVCCNNADMIVYGERGNPYYHSYSDCSGMDNPKHGTLVQALLYGLKRCSKCWVD